MMPAPAPSPCILVVDDDPGLREVLVDYLGQHGFEAAGAASAAEMDSYLIERVPDLVVLDLMMPGEDGLSACRRLIARGGPPVVMLSAMGEDTDRIVGLELGADDYLPKPCNPRELLARIRAVTRRMLAGSIAPQHRGSTAYNFEGWVLDANRRTLISPDGALTDLTSGEFDLLLVFLEHPQRVLNRDQLLDLAHGRSSQAYDRSIDVQISRLRRKIEANPQTPVLIKTVRNEGYFFTATVAGLPMAGGEQ